MGVGREKQRFLSLAQLVEEGMGGMVVIGCCCNARQTGGIAADFQRGIAIDGLQSVEISIGVLCQRKGVNASYVC